MLDWAISKMVMSIAAVTLVIISLFFFSELARDNQIADTNMQDIADQVAGRVNQAAMFQGGIRHNITYSPDPGARGLHLPRRLNDRDYSLEFTNGSVTVIHRSETSTALFSVYIHLYDPDTLPVGELSSGDIASLDFQNRIKTIISGVDLVVENVARIVDGQYTYLTCLYEVGSVLSE